MALATQILTADAIVAAATLAGADLIEVISSAGPTALLSTLTIYRAASAAGGSEAWQVVLPANVNGGARVVSVLGKAHIESGVGLFIGQTDWTGRTVSVAVYRSAT